MTQVVDLSMAFDGKQSEEAVSVIIHPFTASGVTSTTVNCPSGYTWMSFDELQFGGTANSARFQGSFVPKEVVAANPTGWEAEILWDDPAASAPSIQIKATSETSATVTCYDIASPGGFKFMKGVTKKYTTTNLTTVLPVNGGNDITINSRYEIPASALPANFLDENGNIKKNVEVRAEVEVNGSSYSGFSEPDYLMSLNAAGSDFFTYGVKAKVTGNKITIYSGSSALIRNAPNIPNQWGSLAGDIINTPCQVVATLSGEAYTVQTA